MCDSNCVSAGVVAVTAAPMDAKVQQITGMGVASAEEALRALQLSDGNVHAAVEHILSGQGGSGGGAAAAQSPAAAPPPLPPRPAAATTAAAAAAAAADTPSGETVLPLRIILPKCDWLGRACGIITRGPASPFRDLGRGQAICVGTGSSKVPFVLDGPPDQMAIRLASDRSLGLEVNWRKFERDTPCSLWAGQHGPEHSLRWCMNADCTLSPVQAPQLVLGVNGGSSQILLVVRGDVSRRLVFGTGGGGGGGGDGGGGGGGERFGAAVGRFFSGIAARARAADDARVALVSEAAARCDDRMLTSLGRDGFVHLPQAVSRELCRSAKREINRLMGASMGSADQFKGKSFESAPVLTDLFNKSVLPHLMKKLLGGAAPYRQGGAQLALRFPGDGCPGGTAHFNPSHFEHVRRAWHIDGCPSDFLPGKTDHYGRIGNFDCLVGVLLSDIEGPMGGELCCYPGSHRALARHFRGEHGTLDGASCPELERVKAHGNSALPTGAATDALFGGEPPQHCVGRAGDVFLANYMVAHFVAPNASPDIRYAVYFRVHGPSFGVNPHGSSNLRAMLDPWCNWIGVGGGGATGS